MKKCAVFVMFGLGLIVSACGTDPRAGQLLGSVTQSTGDANVCYEVRVDGAVEPARMRQAKASIQNVEGFSPGPCSMDNVKGECAFARSQGGVSGSVIMYADNAAQLQAACNQVGGTYSAR